MDLELLRTLLADDRMHVGLAVVKRVTVADDSTSVAVDCTLLPEGRDIVVTETWESVGAGSTLGDIPDPEDLLIVVMADGDSDVAFSIRRLASQDEKLPKQIKDGNLVVAAKPGKKNYLASDTKILIGKLRDSDPTEPLVLGAVLQSFADSLVDRIKSIVDDIKTGPISLSTTPGNATAPFPAFVAKLVAHEVALDLLKSQFVDTASTNFLAQKVFTERGDS